TATRFLIWSYTDCGTIFLDSSSSTFLNGRPSRIFFAYCSPTPGSALSWSSDAVLRSSGVPVTALSASSTLGAWAPANVALATSTAMTTTATRRMGDPRLVILISGREDSLEASQRTGHGTLVPRRQLY